ncbi:response regulator [Methanoregula sp.]|uniref:hybrid sensor histidine kinase/response regulator n=1 Tax=Methanoregula sp. TaxID=2052170 RepID=UPI00263338A4|nr:response regulator [Methanoregula sp.]MDD5142426.1 response regulator [Methanoregula sp.]
MKGTDAEFTKKLLATFREEAREHLDVIVAILLELEKTLPVPDSATVERIYRTTHSLKGAARAVGQKEIESVCQNLENIFSRMKKGTYVPDADDFDIFHQAVRVIQCLLDGGGQPVTPVTDIVSSLRSLSRKESSPDSSGTHGKQERGKPQEIITAKSPEGKPGAKSSLLERDRGDIRKPPALLSTTGRPERDGATVRIAAHKLDRLIAGSDDLLTTRLFITHRMRELEEWLARFTIWRWNQAAISSDIHRIRERSYGSGKADLPADLVLPLQRLVEFLDYDREFVTYLQHDLAEFIRATDRDRAALEASTSEISELIHDAVLLPVSSVLAPFHGLVREYSRTTGKQVELVIEGGEIEVDRRILDSLKDPLMHLIYNSIDHGIEYPDLRAPHNKSIRGTVRIRVVLVSGGKVDIEVSDDGKGIDGSEIRKAAVRIGLITEQEDARLTDAEAIWLIFRSGFSTSPIITEVSGRGLGLAIVEDTITRLGGYVTIASEHGKGTTTTLRVPVRLVTFRGVVVRSGSQVYVIPMQQVRQVLRIKPDTIFTRGRRQYIRVDDQTIGIVKLSDILDVPPSSLPHGKDAPVSLIVIAYGAGQVACQVDEIVHVQEIVVRPLGSQLRRIRRIAGAAILGDGTLALVLDPPELIQESLRISTRGAAPVQKGAPAPVVLVVEDSVTSRAFLQMLLEREGYRVMTATDGMVAFAILKEHQVDIVVSDVDMPRMNGFVLTEKIRSDPKLHSLPVVLVTSLDSAEDQNHGMAVGADAYIVKSSFERSALLAVVRNLIRTKRPQGR